MSATMIYYMRGLCLHYDVLVGAVCLLSEAILECSESAL